MGNCHPEKTIKCRPRRSRGWHWFSRGDNFPCYFLMQSIFILLYWMLIKYIVYITFGFKTIKVKWICDVCISYSLNSNAHIWRQSESMVNCTRIISAQSIFFGISPVAKFHHVLGRGFMIQRVILIIIKWISANQNHTKAYWAHFRREKKLYFSRINA